MPDNNYSMRLLTIPLDSVFTDVLYPVHGEVLEYWKGSYEIKVRFEDHKNDQLPFNDKDFAEFPFTRLYITNETVVAGAVVYLAVLSPKGVRLRSNVVSVPGLVNNSLAYYNGSATELNQFSNSVSFMAANYSCVQLWNYSTTHLVLINAIWGSMGVVGYPITGDHICLNYASAALSNISGVGRNKYTQHGGSSNSHSRYEDIAAPGCHMRIPVKRRDAANTYMDFEKSFFSPIVLEDNKGLTVYPDVAASRLNITFEYFELELPL